MKGAARCQEEGCQKLVRRGLVHGLRGFCRNHAMMAVEEDKENKRFLSLTSKEQVDELKKQLALLAERRNKLDMQEEGLKKQLVVLEDYFEEEVDEEWKLACSEGEEEVLLQQGEEEVVGQGEVENEEAEDAEGDVTDKAREEVETKPPIWMDVHPSTPDLEPRLGWFIEEVVSNSMHWKRKCFAIAEDGDECVELQNVGHGGANIDEDSEDQAMACPDGEGGAAQGIDGAHVDKEGGECGMALDSEEGAAQGMLAESLPERTWPSNVKILDDAVAHAAGGRAPRHEQQLQQERITMIKKRKKELRARLQLLQGKIYSERKGDPNTLQEKEELRDRGAIPFSMEWDLGLARAKEALKKH